LIRSRPASRSPPPSTASVDPAAVPPASPEPTPTPVDEAGRPPGWRGLLDDPESTRLPLDAAEGDRSSAQRFRERGELAAADAWRRSAVSLEPAGAPSPPPVRPKRPRSGTVARSARSVSDPGRVPRPPRGAPPASYAAPRRRKDPRGPSSGSAGRPWPSGSVVPVGLSSPIDQESLDRWVRVLIRERTSLEAERTELAETRRALAQRETQLATHHRLAVAVDTALRRRHRELTAREGELRQREASLAIPPVAPEPVDARPDLDPGAAKAKPEAGTAAPRAETSAPPSAPSPSFLAGGAPSQSAPHERGGPSRVDRLPSGTPRLDELLLGGLPPRSHVALVGDAFVGKEVLLYNFIAEGLRRQEPAILITANRTPSEIGRALRSRIPEFDEHEREGRVAWIDASGAEVGDLPDRRTTGGSNDMAGLSQALVQASRQCVASSPTGRFRVGFLGLSAVLAHHPGRESLIALQSIVGILRSHEALAMYSLEAGAVTEPLVESLLGRIDGAIVLRQGRGRTLLAAKGFGGVATRDWIECRTTEQGLVLGSFALERIP